MLLNHPETSSPYSLGGCIQDVQLIPEISDSTKPCVYYFLKNFIEV